MTLLRWIVGIPAAALMVAILFLLMSQLIGKAPELEEERETPVLVITAQKKDSTLDPEPEPPSKVPDEAPPPPDLTPDKIDRVDGVPTTPPTGPAPDGGGVTTGPLGGFSPTIRVAPPYPDGCLSRGIEGEVLVQFDVTPEGDVINVEIISSANSCFDAPVKKAVARWKYPPAYSGGTPVMRRGVIEKFVFELEDR